MTKEEFETRLWVMRQVMKYCTRHFLDKRQKAELIDYLTNLGQDDPRQKFVADEWIDNLTDSSSTIGSAIDEMLEHLEKRREMFGKDG